MAGIFRLLRQKWFPPADPIASFARRNVIVTGSNVGLGLEAAIKFVALGASKVILGVRNLEKGRAAKSVIEARTHRADCVEVWQLDMNSYDSIRAFASRAFKELDHLDIAVLNAGVFMPTYQESPHGWEETMQVNTLSTALLGLLLLPKLKASRSADFTPVLEIVSSGLYQVAELTPGHQDAPDLLESYNSPKDYNGSRQYKTSKLSVMYAMRSLASLAESSSGDPDVIVNSVCPGACGTELARGYDSWGMTVGKALLYFFLFRSVEAGSRTLVSGTTLGKKAHGGFWQHDELKP